MSKTTEISPAVAEPVHTVIENVKGERVYLACPDYVSDAAINLSENSIKVLEKRYLRRDYDGSFLETPAGMFYRVAYHVAQVELEHGGDAAAATHTFYDLLSERRFFPNSPTFTGAGTPLGQLAACFVLPIEDDMGRESDGIFSTLRVAALIQQTGGGNGFSFSRLRPKNDLVHTSSGRATGPVGFLRVYDQAFGEIAQGGSRRGANMGVLRVDHPDIEEFITCKAEEGKIANFNISVAITDEFMAAVRDDTDFNLRNPRDGKIWRTVRARDLFAKIVKFAHHNGEPGALFIDAANRTNPVPHLYDLEATNPCVPGETLVATPQGWRRADSIQVGDEICTVLGKGRVAEVEVNPNVPVYRIYFSDGASLRATAAHQFHARESRTKFFAPVRVDELKVGDWVRVYRSALPANPAPAKPVGLSDREYGFLVGVLVGDGCYTEHALSKNVVRVSTSCDDEPWNEILKATFAKVGAEKMYSYVNEGSRSMMMDPKPGKVVASLVRSLPLEPARAPEKRLPDVYINSNGEFLRGLLDGLFSTDGSVDLQSNHPLVRFHTSSQELAQQVRRILLMFGIHGRVSASLRKRHDLNGRAIRNDRPKYDVTISGESFGRFFEQISLTHLQKQMRMEEAALRSNFTGGNWAAKVVKIEPDGVETVYDLYEPKSDTWITEGFVSRGCGEQWLGPYENCCLGSINLAQHVTKTADGETVVDWELLLRTIYESTHFLDNVVSANSYVPAVPEVAEAAYRARRIGLGIMGLGDLMYQLGIRYGSEEGQEFAAQVMEFVRYACMERSIALAKERGSFLAFTDSIYDPQQLGGMKWQPPTPLRPFERDWKRPPLDWSSIVHGIEQYGLRNAAQTTVAPTGTIATVVGCEGYGCEPVFALGYIRHFKDGDRDVELYYTSPLFEHALNATGLSEADKSRIKQHVAIYGTCQDLEELPKHLHHTFVVSSDITAEEHVLMQAAIQAFTDNSISKTCNFPEGASEEDVAKAYVLAWETGCKGLTVYVTGSRQIVVLETKATRGKKDEPAAATEPVIVNANGSVHAANGSNGYHVEADAVDFDNEFRPAMVKRPRPKKLHGVTYRKETPLGTAYITVNSDESEQPFEVFMNVGKAGTEVTAVSEAVGRLISLVLRMPAALPPTERLRWVTEELVGIGGGRPLGFGANRVRSLPDGVAQVLAEHLSDLPQVEEEVQPEQLALPINTKPIGDICPECGEASFLNVEGCRKCHVCGYSEC
jgi:ribonucleotide reductase alpha subunit